MTLDSVRRRLIDARDARAAAIVHLAGSLPDGHALVFLSLNVPGPEKTSARLERLFRRVAEVSIGTNPGDTSETRPDPSVPRILHEGRDALGPWLALSRAGAAADVKRRCVAIEETLPAGRLVDLDVFGRDAAPIGRGSLGLPARRCLACGEAAVDCIRTARHTGDELARLVARLLHASECGQLADALVQGARIELELTPKPGLVDRLDNGSHPDLTLDLMSRSIDLLPEYYRELLQLRAQLERCPTPGSAAATGRPRPAPDLLPACIASGRRAEQRMVDAIGANAHRGYIFLSGLVLLGFAEAASSRQDACPAASWRTAIADMARRIAGSRVAPMATHGGVARRRHGVAGILGEALNGLPSVFEHGLPALERAEARFGQADVARHCAMATLMSVVEDTTALHRCGTDGLERLKRDGERILAAIDGGADYVPLLGQLNAEYRAAGLTMGGVADCLAIVIALRLTLG